MKQDCEKLAATVKALSDKATNDDELRELAMCLYASYGDLARMLAVGRAPKDGAK